MYTSGYARTSPFNLSICEYWRGNTLNYGFVADNFFNSSTETVDWLVVGVAPCAPDDKQGRYMPVWTVTNEDIKRVWSYNVPLRKWNLILNTNETPSNYVVETGIVHNDKANEAEGQPEAIQEAA